MNMKRNTKILLSVLLVLLVCSTNDRAAEKGSQAITSESAYVNILLCRPEEKTFSLNILPLKNIYLFVEYGLSEGSYILKTDTLKLTGGLTYLFLLKDLKPDIRYYYRVRYQETGGQDFLYGDAHSFHTRRLSGSSFTFTMEADPHLYDKKGNASLMKITLQNQLKDNPDFMMDLGDTFGDDHEPFTITNDEIKQLHLNFRNTLSQISHSVPFLFCIGNHEGEFGYYLSQNPPNNLGVYATLARKYYFPNPVPDDFYSGNIHAEDYGIGLPENYYAFEWGDALFVVLDAYRAFTGNAKPRSWEWTLGKEQYDWFKQTLENSKAKFKFVITHHILGQTRGGVQVAQGYEWGGYDKNYSFDTFRPGWGLPIHQLMVKNGVKIFFQGHDHLYAKEELDGIVYQTVPMPSDSTYKIGVTDNGDAFSGIKLDGSGHLRVTVSSDKAQVDYIRALLPADETTQKKNGETVFSYSVFSGAPSADTVRFICREMLGRPEDKSVTVNFCADKDIEAYAEYGTSRTVYSGKTEVISSSAGIPLNIVIAGLSPNTEYYYRVRYRQKGTADYLTGNEYSFRTAKLKGNAFTFAVEADPHLDSNTDPEVYKLTLKNILASDPDFLLDLGDTFMSEKLSVPSQDSITIRHLLLRSYFDIVGHSIPLFLVLGNHEGELGWLLDGTSSNIAVMASNTRTKYYPNPVPDNFYSGNSKAEQFVGLRQNYYSWEWGNALFVVLDPYWYTTIKPSRTVSNWNWTLGGDQYLWFKNVLEKSSAKFKFVFAHQVVGGVSYEGRGGTEAVPFYEMGGKNTDSTWGFPVNRPGWELPLHQLMLKNRVNIFFHGHDHLYARQELDGVIYQEVPQPGSPNYKDTDPASSSSYVAGKLIPS
ncbi:MAG: metallophosphoesterase, partial [Syntrophothermus sp.]